MIFPTRECVSEKELLHCACAVCAVATAGVERCAKGVFLQMDVCGIYVRPLPVFMGSPRPGICGFNCTGVGYSYLRVKSHTLFLLTGPGVDLGY